MGGPRSGTIAPILVPTDRGRTRGPGPRPHRRRNTNRLRCRASPYRLCNWSCNNRPEGLSRFCA